MAFSCQIALILDNLRCLALGVALILDNLRCLASQGKWNEFRVSANPRQFTWFSVAGQVLGSILVPPKNTVLKLPRKVVSFTAENDRFGAQTVPGPTIPFSGVPQVRNAFVRVLNLGLALILDNLRGLAS